MRRSLRLVMIASLLCTLGLNALAQTSSEEEAIETCRALVDSLMHENHIPGIAIAVAQGDRMIWSEGFGYADLEAKSPVYPTVSRFRVGSISKTLTSVALARLYEQGKISLDSTVQLYVPYFPVKRYPVTLAQVAGHIAGIRHYRGLEFLSTRRYMSVKSGLEIFKDDSLLFEPGTAFTYSSYGWNLISAVVENASGVEFLTYMRDSVFHPLGMMQTVADFHERIQVGRTGFYMINNHQWINAPHVDNSYKWAGGGFLSTATDLVRFAQGQLKHLSMTEDTFRKWTTSLETSDGVATDYGIGWRIGRDSRDRTWVGHSGGSVGGTSRMMIYPNSGLIIIILTNLSQADLGDLSDQIATAFP